jgi:glutamine synthetase
MDYDRYSAEEVRQFVEEDDVKFIRLAYCDIFGHQKNISLMPSQLEHAFQDGIAIDASAIDGFDRDVHSDLFLFPDPSTLMLFPWRPEHGRVVRMFCQIRKPDGTIFEHDTRSLLIKAVEDARAAGLEFFMGSEKEFYLFRLDENGEPTHIPIDQATYMDIAPADRGVNIRREICLTLEEMGISPTGSHHESGPGQNEVDFNFDEALTAADNSIAFTTAVQAVASQNGLYADFSPKPLSDADGSSFHVNLSVRSADGKDYLMPMTAGILDHILEMTAFLNPTEASYHRLGHRKAPKYISWDRQNRSQLIRVPATLNDKYRRIELRSPDNGANPYLAMALLIYAGMDGIKRGLALPDPIETNLFTAEPEVLDQLQTLPASRSEATGIARNSAFIQEHLPASLIKKFCHR